MTQDRPKKKRPVPNAARARNAAAGRGSSAKQSSKKKMPSQRRVAKDLSGSGDEATLNNLSSVIVRNEFYRDGYRFILRLAVIQGMIIIGLIGVMFYVVKVHQPVNQYFATTEDGRAIPMVPLDQANLSTPALMSWVAQASTEVMTFGFNDYRRRLQESSRNFTRNGWSSFTAALQRSSKIDNVIQKRQVITAAPEGAPILTWEGLAPTGRYEWRVQIPMILSHESGSRSTTERLLVEITIVRVSRLDSPNGVGIEQWLAQPR